MGRTILVKGVPIGTGSPKVCVPLLPVDEENLFRELDVLKDLDFDLIEWRIDYFKTLHDQVNVQRALKMIKAQFPSSPLITTLRTADEGGMMEIRKEEYVSIYKQLIDSGFIDILDIQLNMGEEVVRDLIEYAHAKDIYTIISYHNFEETPPKEELIQLIIRGQNLDGDIIKLAVMPHTMTDVLILLESTYEAYENITDRPIVTMAMGKLGLITRICGEWFGSSITFGSAAEASAPGQLHAKQLKEILSILHLNKMQ